MFNDTKRKCDQEVIIKDIQDFIPIACHYNEDTLLTKNGDLVKIMQVHGLNADYLSDNLLSIRDKIREVIAKHINSNQFAIWIHTIRKKTNLDDRYARYPQEIAAKMHKKWVEKNYWNDKFVNNLYLTIVYSGAKFDIVNGQSFLASLSFATINDFHSSYLQKVHTLLQNKVNAIMGDLESIGIKKLKIHSDAFGCYSEPLSHYSNLINYRQTQIPVPLKDYSEVLTDNNFSFFNNYFIAKDANGKEKYASILSLKEYYEIDEQNLDMFLQIPSEFVITETITFMAKKDIEKKLKFQKKILGISNDQDVYQRKYLDQIFDEEDIPARFTSQQISIAIFADDQESLSFRLKRASEELSKLGLVHVQEDVNLEKTFWAQLPGNFNFLWRKGYSHIKYSGPFTSLHNFPTGALDNPWGKAITILRTATGTPYFFNFHDCNNIANIGIFGYMNSGKTVLMNFLIAEANKFSPEIFYISGNNRSKIFIDLLDGKWHSNSKNGIINPLLIPDDKKQHLILKNFLQIICYDPQNALSEEEHTALDKFADDILKIPEEERKLGHIYQNYDFTSNNLSFLKSKLKMFGPKGELDGVFDSDVYYSNHLLQAVNIESLSTDNYKQKYYPDDDKLLPEYEKSLQQLANIRASYVNLLIECFINDDSSDSSYPRILALDLAFTYCNHDYFANNWDNLLKELKQKNCVLISTISLDQKDRLNTKSFDRYQEVLATKIVIANDRMAENVKELLQLGKEEFNAISDLQLSSRLFLLKQQNLSILVELSLGGADEILNILSANDQMLQTYKELCQTTSDKNQLYEHLIKIKENE